MTFTPVPAYPSAVLTVQTTSTLPDHEKYISLREFHARPFPPRSISRALYPLNISIFQRGAQLNSDFHPQSSSTSGGRGDGSDRQEAEEDVKEREAEGRRPDIIVPGISRAPDRRTSPGFNWRGMSLGLPERNQRATTAE